jgi:hypothetical protein
MVRYLPYVPLRIKLAKYQRTITLTGPPSFTDTGKRARHG